LEVGGRSFKSSEIMTKLLLVGIVLLNFSAFFAQVAQTSIAPKVESVTQRYLSQRFSLEDQLVITASPEKLARLNYMYALSYEFTSDQMVLKSQKILFDIEKYNAFRMPSQRVKITDMESGLTVVLYSWNEVEEALLSISTTFQLADCK
jgi:hypothetical protein